MADFRPRGRVSDACHSNKREVLRRVRHGRWRRPSLVGDDYTYARVATDVGMFEVIYSGASGEMQAFSKRGLTQDQILRIIAYVRSLTTG